MDTKSNISVKRHSFKIANSESDRLRLTIEPWAEEFVLESGDTFVLIADFPEDWVPMFVFHQNRLVVFECYDGVGCYFRLETEDGTLLRSIEDYPKSTYA